MNKIVPMTLLGLTLGALAMPSVHAQSTQPVQKPTSIKLGVYLPTDGSARTYAGSTLFAVGVDYAFEKTASDSPIEPLVYFDYTGGGRNGGRADLYDAGIGIRAYPDRYSTDTVIPFYGLGIGVDVLDAHGGKGASSTNTQFGGKAEIGVEMSSGPFVEAEYQYVPQKAGNVRADGFNLMLGDRF